MRVARAAFPLLLALALPAAADVEAPPPDKTIHLGDLVSVFGDDVRVPAGTVQHGSVVCIGCRATIEGEVVGDVVVVMGSLAANGRIEGNAVGVLSDLELHDADIGGDLINVGGALDSQTSDVAGKTVNLGIGRWWLPGMPSPVRIVNALLFWFRLIELLLAFVVILAVVALAPQRIQVLSDEAPVRYVPAFFTGLLGYLGYWILQVLLVATVIGIPVAMMLWLAFHVFKWMGVAGIFHAVGRQWGRSWGRSMSMLGAILLVFGLYALLSLLPTFFGWVGIFLAIGLRTALWLFLKPAALGLVLLTRAGGRTSAPPQTAPVVAG
ncbi:MAG TPA: hypothetical protein VJS92_15825 [Candidatus Polarisedimenticolaceae bacterium]|nr:hypothetical protein [Candidatus Polarisedimenticolaceae bacterium]